ncbi:MAG: efflux RND transporter permease subunit, partial [Alphaproteobacteria bacterium]|nr:efflux RND transporter permease subunit [Alphaproteobacteria bacterium]
MRQFDPDEIKDIKQGPILMMAAHPVAANLLMVLIIIGGIFFLLQSKKEVFPEFDLDLVKVTMVYPGASPEEIEKSIVLPIENALRDVDGLENISSTSSEGFASVTAEIIEKDEMIRIAQDVKTAIDQITTFPVDAEDLTVSIPSRRNNLIDIILSGSADENILRSKADFVMERMEQHEYIGSVELSGVRDYEIHIEIPQENLRRYNLTFPSVATLISRTAIEIGGGALKSSSGEILVRMDERRDTAIDFTDIPIIKQADGNVVTLGDIAEIKDTFTDKNIYSTYREKPAIRLKVYTVVGQSPIDVSTAVKSKIEELEPLLDGDFQLDIVSDESVTFAQRAELLTKNGMFGLILVIIFLSLFLDLRLAFWVSMGIPISYMGSFLIFPATDFSLNMVSMFAFIITLGIVVDDAIVVGENIYHKRETGMKPLHASVEGAREMAIPVMVSVVTNMVAFIPMLFMTGFMGKIFALIPTVVLAVFFISLLESLFILPAHLTFRQAKTMKDGLLKKLIDIQKKFNKGLSNFIRNTYCPILEKIIRLRYVALATFIAILLATGGYAASGRVGMVLFDPPESDFSYGVAVLPVGSPDRLVKTVEQKMLDAAQSNVEAFG